MIEGRVFIPRDVFTTLCVEVQRMSEHLLTAAKLTVRVTNSLPDDMAPPSLGEMLKELVAANALLGSVEGILKIIIEEMPPSTPPSSTPPSTPPTTEGGQSCHA